MHVVLVEPCQEVAITGPIAGHVVGADLVEHALLVHDESLGNPRLIGGEIVKERRVWVERDGLG